MENYEMEKTKFFLDKYFQLILEKDRTMIFVVQILIALLVIASFNNRIIPDSDVNSVKILITFLLFLTTITLIDYLLKLDNGLNAHAKVLGDESSRGKKWFKKLIDGSSYLYALVAIIIIDIIIALIIQNLLMPLFASLVQILIIAIYIFKK